MGRLTIDLNNFTVVKKHDIDKDAPYLWVMGILVDINTLKSGNYIIKKNPTYGNLGGKFKKGESRAISDNLGRIDKTVLPLGPFLTAGIVVVAWEKATSKDSTRQKAYDDSVEVVNDFIAGRIALFNTDPPSSTEMKQLEADIEEVVRKDFKEDWTIWHPLVDHFIDSEQYQTALDATKSFSRDLSFRFCKGSTDYRISGRFSYTP